MNQKTLEDVQNDYNVLGPVVGRVANRISGAEFVGE